MHVNGAARGGGARRAPACARFPKPAANSPPAIIRHAVWLYLRFALSCRDVEDLPAERGIDASSETVRRWTLKFGAAYAWRIRQRRPRPTGRWHLDEVFGRIHGRIFLAIR